MVFTERKSLGAAQVSIRIQALAAAVSVVAAVALPQILHVVGAGFGLGSTLGEMLLPMHLPIILVGLLAGPWAGASAGFLAPLVSFALTAMPGRAMLPFIVIELCVYGLVAGLLRTSSMPNLGKVVIVQISGRAIRAAAILLAVMVLGVSSVPVSVIWTSISVGVFGLALQWVLIPAILRWVVKQDVR